MTDRRTVEAAIAGRREDPIVLSSGEQVYAAEIEARYATSAFVKEVCVLAGAPLGIPEPLYAVVVPDMDLVRRKRIVNVGDLLRFELEGQSIHLSPAQRVGAYEIWFDDLPRTAEGRLRRDEIAQRVDARRRAAGERAAGAGELLNDPFGREVAAEIGRHAAGRAIVPDANLELDLGLDSVQRVEILASLERRFGARIPPDKACGIFTVSHLVDALREAAAAECRDTTERSWDAILRSAPPEIDENLRSLRRRRLLIPLALFALLRALRPLLPRIDHDGLDNLPESGPYILAPNHQSYLDPLVVCSVLPLRVMRELFFVGATEYFESPVTAWMATKVNLVPVDPDANLVPAMQAAAFGLAQGRVLLLFPEGERSIDGAVKRFKKGAAILSRHLAVPVVPVAIRGVYEVWPRNRPFAWRLLFRRPRHAMRVRFGAPVVADDNATYRDEAEALRQRVCALWADAR